MRQSASNDPDPDGLKSEEAELEAIEAEWRRAFTPPTVSAEHAEAWQAKLDAPPRELPGLRKFLAEYGSGGRSARQPSVGHQDADNRTATPETGTTHG